MKVYYVQNIYMYMQDIYWTAKEVTRTCMEPVRAQPRRFYTHSQGGFTRPAKEVTPGRAACGGRPAPVAGNWSVRVVVRVPDFNSSVYILLKEVRMLGEWSIYRR